MGIEWGLRDDYQTRISLKKSLNQPYLLLHEYIMGIDSLKVMEQRAHKLLHIFPNP